jgi:hypothetical protein
MESIHSNDLDLNSENDLIELSEDELDQIHGGLFWLALPEIATIAIGSLKIAQLGFEGIPEEASGPSFGEALTHFFDKPASDYWDRLQGAFVKQMQAETRPELS